MDYLTESNCFLPDCVNVNQAKIVVCFFFYLEEN